MCCKCVIQNMLCIEQSHGGLVPLVENNDVQLTDPKITMYGCYVLCRNVVLGIQLSE